MGLSTSKQKTTSAQDTKESGSTTPTNPQWVTDQVQTQGQHINDFLARDPQSLVAGPSALQQQAFAGAENLGGWQAGSDRALGMAEAAGSAPVASYSGPKLGAASQVGDVNVDSQSLLDGFSNYMDPATKALVDASMASYDAQADQQRAALMADGARNGAFGGSRFGIAEGQFEADSGRNRALTDAQLRTAAFSQAANMSGQDASRRQDASTTNASMDLQRMLTNAGSDNQNMLAQAGFDANAGMFNASQEEAARMRALQAAGLMGDLSYNAGANSRADLGMTADLGAIQQAIAQAQAGAPASQLLTAGQAMSAMPYNLFNGQNMSGTSSMTGSGTATSKPSLFSMGMDLGKMVGNAVAAGSDHRLKRDIERIGSHGKLNLYSYNYHWDAPDRARRTGVMADEVAMHAPEALGPEIAGYRTVNYEQLGLAHLVEEV